MGAEALRRGRRGIGGRVEALPGGRLPVPLGKSGLVEGGAVAEQLVRKGVGGDCEYGAPRLSGRGRACVGCVRRAAGGIWGGAGSP